MELTNRGNSVAGEIPQQDRGGSVVVVGSQNNTESPSLAAVLNENDRKRRQRLVPKLVRLLFGALDETNQGEEKEDPKNYNQDVEWDVVEEIVGTTSGSIQLQLSTLLSTSKTRWNQNRPLTIHWSWKTPSCDGNSAVAYSTCVLSMIAEEGVTIELPVVDIEKDPVEKDNHTKQSAQSTMICHASRFQWTLEGSGGCDENVRSFWRLQGITLWMDTPDMDSIAFTINELTLASEITDNGESNQQQQNRDCILRLESDSNLTICGLLRSKKILPGNAKATLSNYFNTFLEAPNVRLSLMSETGNLWSPALDESSSEVPERTTLSSLGDALNCALQHSFVKPSQQQLCREDSSITATTARTSCSTLLTESSRSTSSSTRYMSMGDTAVTECALVLTATSFSPLGGVVSLAALAAKDGVEAAARKGREHRVSLDPEHQENKYKFGDFSRGIVGSAKETGRGVVKVAREGTELRLSSSFRDEDLEPSEATSSTNSSNNSNSNNKTSKGGYKFGDFTRGIASRTKRNVVKLARRGTEFRIANEQQKNQREEREQHEEQQHQIDLEKKYKFGDFSRGIVGSVRERKQNQDPEEGGGYIEQNKGRLASVAGGTTGAVVGFAVGGPVGSVAGSLLGSAIGQTTVKVRSEEYKPGDISKELVGSAKVMADRSQKIGENLENIVAKSKGTMGQIVDKGKVASGRESTEDYRFGDFVRGVKEAMKKDTAAKSPRSTRSNH